MPVSTQQFCQFKEHCRAARVTPTVLILRHYNGCNHFQALRLSEELYREYQLEDEPTTMRTRLDEALTAVGIPLVDYSTAYDFDTQDLNLYVSKPGSDSTETTSTSNSDAGAPGGQTLAAERITVRRPGTAYLRILEYHRTGGPLDGQDAVCLQECFKENDEGWTKWRDHMGRARVIQHFSAKALQVVDIADAESFRQLKILFFQIPHPALVVMDIGIAKLMEWGEQQALRAQGAFLERIMTTGSYRPTTVKQATQWATALDTVGSRELRMPLANNTQRWERLRQAAKLSFDGSLHAFSSRKHWALAHIPPYLFWHWRPVSKIHSTPMDVRKQAPDVECEELITGSLMYRMQAIQRILDNNDWSGTSTVVLCPEPYEPASPVPWDSSADADRFTTSQQC